MPVLVTFSLQENLLVVVLQAFRNDTLKLILEKVLYILWNRFVFLQAEASLKKGGHKEVRFTGKTVSNFFLNI